MGGDRGDSQYRGDEREGGITLFSVPLFSEKYKIKYCLLSILGHFWVKEDTKKSKKLYQAV
jgi:hypothetical protein